MRSIVLAVTLLVATIATIPSCHSTPGPVVSAGSAVGSAGACELGAIEQVVTTDGVSIVYDIFSAVVSGGSTLPKLLADLIGEFGPPTVQCAATLVADLANAIAPPSTGSGSNVSLTASAARTGRSVLLSEMDKHGWPHGK